MKLDGQMYCAEPLERAIAKTCHAANLAIQANIGEPFIVWPEAPEWMKASAIEGVNFCWAVLEAGEEPNPATQHKAWMESKFNDGWTYGPEKDSEKKTHPLLVPYDELELEHRMKDYVFIAIVKAYHTALAK